MKFNKVLTGTGTGLAIFFCLSIAFCSFTAPGRELKNSYDKWLRKADDRSQYGKLKEVEDNARAMMANFVADSLFFEQYKDSKSDEERSWSTQAKIKANRTAASYNEFILKNSFIWKENVPSDIKSKIAYIP